MLEFEGFGLRIQQLRKKKQMTQEDLADRMGVTSQAVSKWETGLSYPDITLIPTLAAVLGTDIEYIFGSKTDVQQAKEFPETYEGLPLVHIAGGVACYSDKAVLSVDETGVKFADGSTAELSSKMAVNMGQGEISFLQGMQQNNWKTYDMTVNEKQYEFGCLENIDITLNEGNCTVVRSADGKTRVTVSGDPRFMFSVKVEEIEGTLKVGWKNDDKSAYASGKNNEIRVELPYDAGGSAKVNINGYGSCNSEIQRFRTGKLGVNGSGGIRMMDFDELCKVGINGSGDVKILNAGEFDLGINGSGNIEVKAADKVKIGINGSGNIEAKAARAVKVGINGSGNVDVKRLTGGGDFSAGINGSGDVEVKDGECERFDVEISGSGNVTAKGVTARNAKIILKQDGEVVLGRVLESCTEQIKKKGKIVVLKRG
jgi:transcriptional regulator with XRE-family HTH domain